MKLLKLFLVSIVIVAFNCCKSSTKSKIEVLESMDEEITVDAVSNCIILDSSSAAHILLSENIYTVTASNHSAEYTSGELFSHIYISCKGRYFNLLDLDSSVSLRVINPDIC
ncbi:unnamed protein product [marine sediment metagenome]|uniref:Uncharacterized protein n=1 Tax=marine sediment metagenome TaxID=412755 RepID=X1ILU0_9ZZZZ